jgi:hypothetical protein
VGRTHAEDGVLADQLHLGVADAALGVALAVGLDVAEVANVAVVVAGATVALAVGVDWLRWSAYVWGFYALEGGPWCDICKSDADLGDCCRKRPGGANVQ